MQSPPKPRAVFADNLLTPCSPYPFQPVLEEQVADFREAALSCHQILATASRILDVRWPKSAPQVDVERTWPAATPRSEAYARWHKRQFTPDSAYRLLREYCPPAAPGQHGWRPCDVPAADLAEFQGASIFHTRLTCTRPIGTFDALLSCVPFDLAAAETVDGPQTITRAVDVFRGNQHARLPTLPADTRYDPAFCNGMFRLIERLGISDHAT